MSKPRDIFPFTEVIVSVSPDRSKLIQWTMNPIFRTVAEVAGFHVDMSRGGEWTRLTDTPIIDMCLYIDTLKHRCGLRADIFYRVVAVDTASNEYKSKPVNIFQYWKDKPQWLIARDIIRKEYLRLNTLPTGVAGTLLKRRQHGPRCTTCTDHDLGEVVASCCPLCFGTGFLGGYYNGIPYSLDLSGTASKEQKTATFGTVNNKQRTARAVAFPLVSEYDVWVADKSNLRFIINTVQNTGETLIIPLIYQLGISELVQRDGAYDIPLTQDMADIHTDTSDIVDDSLDIDITTNTVW
jgi:hypothetical protein